MKAAQLPIVYAVGGIVAAAVIGWYVTRLMDKLAQPGAPGNLGKAVGGGVVDFTLGTVAGINDGLGIPRTSDVIDWTNSSSNPAQPVGAWIGSTVHDWTHSKAEGGIW